MNGYIGNDNRETNERRTDTGGTNSQWMRRSYLPCDRRDRVIFRTAQRNHYPAAWEFATARGTKQYNLPFRKFLRLFKPRSWTGDPEHMKYQSISLGPLAHAGIMDYVLKLYGNIYVQKQVGRVWYTHLTNIFVNKVGFKQSKVDECFSIAEPGCMNCIPMN